MEFSIVVIRVQQTFTFSLENPQSLCNLGECAVRANQALWWCGCTHIWNIPDISIKLMTECHIFLMAFLGHYLPMLEGTMTKFTDE